MELYYKGLISEDASVEKLADDLMFLVQGVDQLAETAGAGLGPLQQQELRTRLERLKDTCVKLKQQALFSAKATDKLLRKHPYSSLGFAFTCGLLIAALVHRRR